MHAVIIVNGKHKHVSLEQISYEQAVAIANEDRPTPWTGLHTVTYSYLRQNLKGGSLAPGESAPVHNDMVISAMVTSGA
jgi:hypothetical protein